MRLTWSLGGCPLPRSAKSSGKSAEASPIKSPDKSGISGGEFAKEAGCIGRCSIVPRITRGSTFETGSTAGKLVGSERLRIRFRIGAG